MLGITFKENCPDIRNTKAIDVYNELDSYGVDITLYDPWADKDEVKHEYDIDIVNEKPNDKFDAVILTVSHNEYADLNIDGLKKPNSVIYDVKGFLPKEMVDARL